MIMSDGIDFSSLDYYHQLLLIYLDKLSKEVKIENYREIDKKLGDLITYHTIRDKVKDLVTMELVRISKKGNRSRPIITNAGIEFVEQSKESNAFKLVAEEIEKQLKAST